MLYVFALLLRIPTLLHMRFLPTHTSFFLFQFGEVAVIMAAGAIAIGPRGMPKFARQVGHTLGTAVRCVLSFFFV